MSPHDATKLIVDILCIGFIAGLVWMWVVGSLVEAWLYKRRERRVIRNRMSKMRKNSNEEDGK